jgi:predicted O-linked N-acetylglucosamine transferase (SPINDLY family)
MIREDAIDILINLDGHFTDNRLMLLARRPAPLQINMLACPGPLGLSTIDYRITDKVLDPSADATDLIGAEALLRLSPGFMCYTPQTSAPQPCPLPVASRGCITFGSMGSPATATSAAIDLWCDVLRQVPRSRFALATEERDWADEHLKNQFESRGIDISRLDFVRRPSVDPPLNVYQRIDISLDPIPVSGWDCVADSLWMGVPAITLCGERIAGRIGASTLTAAGLDEFIAADRSEYVELATRLAGDLPKLSQLRSVLREQVRRSPLTNVLAYTRELEAALRTIWRRWCA